MKPNFAGWLVSPVTGKMNQMPVLKLKSGREKSVVRRHPWVFSGAISAIQGAPGDGETVRIVDSHGTFLAWGAYSSQSQITARIWSWNEAEVIDQVFFRQRIQTALLFRRSWLPLHQTDALRLVHGESDGIPGLIVDQYTDTLVAQFLSCGVEYWRAELVRILAELTGLEKIYERSDAEVRQLEGLAARCGPLLGGDFPDQTVIHENGLQFQVDLHQGHKTGFYLDQRNNRMKLRSLAQGKTILDCFCYTGGFSLNALAGGADDILAVDASPEALRLAQHNLALNGQEATRVEWLTGDVFQVLRGLRDRARSFDLVILDPPKFAPTAAQVQRAARGYKDINRLAFKLIKPEGLLVTFSCSGGVTAELFQKIVADAALDANVGAQIVEHLFQAEDHPVAMNFPEGAYLKGLVIRVHN